MNKWLVATTLTVLSTPVLALKYDVVVVDTLGGNASHVNALNDNNVFVGASRRAIDVDNGENDDDEDVIEMQGYLYSSPWQSTSAVLNLSSNAAETWDLDAEFGYNKYQRSTFTYGVNEQNWVVGFGDKRVYEDDGLESIVEVPFYFDGTQTVEMLKNWQNTDIVLRADSEEQYEFTEEYYNRDGRFLAINNQGLIAGWLTTEYAGYIRERAVLFDSSKLGATDAVQVIDFVDFVEGRDNRDAPSRALDINDEGVVVGVVELEHSNGDVFEHAYVYENGAISLLPTWDNRSDDDELDSFAYAINQQNMIVGNAVAYVDKDEAGRKTDVFQAFYYQSAYGEGDGAISADSVLTPIEIPADKVETLLPEDHYSKASAINDSGVVVGTYRWADRPLRKHAFMYNIETGVFTDLNDLVDCGSDGYPDFELTEASAINEQGVIAGVMLYRDGNTETPESRGFLLTPDLNGEATPCNFKQILQNEAESRDDSLAARSSGGAFGIYGLIFAFLVVGTRRFLRVNK